MKELEESMEKISSIMVIQNCLYGSDTIFTNMLVLLVKNTLNIDYSGHKKDIPRSFRRHQSEI